MFTQFMLNLCINYSKYFGYISYALIVLNFVLKARMKQHSKAILVPFVTMIIIYDIVAILLLTFVMVYLANQYGSWIYAVKFTFDDGNVLGVNLVSNIVCLVVTFKNLSELIKFKRNDKITVDLSKGNFAIEGGGTFTIDMAKTFRDAYNKKDKNCYDCFNLTSCYYRGLGTNKDLPKALYWVNETIKMGNYIDPEQLLSLKADIIKEMKELGMDIIKDSLD